MPVVHNTPLDLAHAADEARIRRLVDARCLEHQLNWLRHSLVALPVDLMWGLLAQHTGVALRWWLTWVVVRLAMHLGGAMLAKRWLPLVASDPGLGLRRAQAVFVALGLWHTTLMPVFYFGTDDLTKLLAMALAASYFGGVIIAASGQQATFWATVLPGYAVYVAGWAQTGGWLGWLAVFILVQSMPLIALSIRQQRRTWESLVRAAEDNQALAASLAIERDRAQAAADARTRFFAAASHDLRQPLHALAINATTLDLLTRDSADARLRTTSQDIARALAQSRGLLDALLDISRLDAGAVHLHLVTHDVAALLQQLHADHAGLAAQRGLDFTLQGAEPGAWAHTDADQLQRLLGNLLDNAMKFTAAGSVVLSLARETGAQGAPLLCITVTDTGCGVPAAEHERVFEEFYQIGNPSRDRNQGLGLGLAIVRRTAALLGAQVRLAEPPPGGGSRFEVRLPALAGLQRAAPGAGTDLPQAAWPGSAAASSMLDSRAGSDVASTTTGAEQPRRASAAAAAVPATLPPTPPATLSTAPLTMPPALNVLLVDDEADILRAQCSLLRAVGWTPLAADGAQAALALAADPGVDLDIAVVDHRLPRWGDIGDGIALVQRLRTLRPGLPALIVTGDVAVIWAVQRHGLAVLHKPLAGNTLTRAIADQAAAATRWATRLQHFNPTNQEPPMNLIDAMHGRRSVRTYQTTPVPRDLVEDLLWHAVQVPLPPASAADCWAFVAVEGRDWLADCGARAKHFAATHQPPGQVWTWPSRPDFEVFWGAPLLLVFCARHGHPEAPFDCCRAGQNFSLLAHARGLGSCWVGSPMPWLHSDEGRRAIGIPAGFDPAVALVVGYAQQATPGQSRPAPPLLWAAPQPVTDTAAVAAPLVTLATIPATTTAATTTTAEPA